MNIFFQDRYGESPYDAKDIDFVDEIQIYPPHFDEDPYNSIAFIGSNETDNYSISVMTRIKIRDKQIYSVETNGSCATIITVPKGEIEYEHNDE